MLKAGMGGFLSGGLRALEWSLDKCRKADYSQLAQAEQTQACLRRVERQPSRRGHLTAA
jgi:hypothetical protein